MPLSGCSRFAVSDNSRLLRRTLRNLSGRARSVDPLETSKFEAEAERWWDTSGGPFAPLHAMSPVRCAFVRDALCRHFGRDSGLAAPLAGLRLLDVGCGGGLLCVARQLVRPRTRSRSLSRTEPLCRMGAQVLGVDAAERSVVAARAHAARDPLVASRASYRAAAAEELAGEGCTFDAVLSLEVMEHVADVPAFAATLASLVTPDGLLLLSTINRTVRSYALGILAAEHLLGLVPRGTHDWARFLTPPEVAGAHQASTSSTATRISPAPSGMLLDSGFEVERLAGMVYSPLSARWSLSSDTAVNYILSAKRVSPV